MSLRIAMWSGPRNISTALMRSFEARGDCAVCDEPLYAHYLVKTGERHPGYQEVIASQSKDWREVVTMLQGPIPESRAVWYQKHMAHHLLPTMEREWMRAFRHCLLIRSPREVLASYLRARGTAVLADLGFELQCDIMDYIRRELDQVPIVIDSRDVLEAPGKLLPKLCEALEIDYRPTMLAWSPGSRETDGVWAKHWYGSVETSTGFSPYVAKPCVIPEAFQGVLKAAEPLYQRLYQARIRP